MAKEMIPLEDDELDNVTGGTTLNDPNACQSWMWNGGESTENCCATCKKTGTPMCFYGK